jgi:uncharacterized protein Veg
MDQSTKLEVGTALEIKQNGGRGKKMQSNGEVVLKG